MTIYPLLAGGTANQVFQYAAALALAGQGNEHEVICDTSWLEAHSDPASGITPRKFELDFLEAHSTNAPPADLIRCGHDQLPYDYDSFKNYRLTGYFQDLKFWQPWIREHFRSHVPPCHTFAQGRSMSIHVRRGDYVTNPSATHHHGVMTAEYFVEAAELLKTMYPVIERAYVFSEDQQWCEDNLRGNLPVPMYFMSTMVKYPWHDIVSMANCEYHVISNSTFGWLAAYLSHAKRVVYPKAWLTHGKPKPPIFPQDWIEL